MQIMVGTNKLRSGGTRYSINYTIPHDGYIRNHSNDIGLIRLQTPIEFNENVQAIRYSTLHVPENTELKVFGFGQLSVSIIYKQLS